MYVAAIDLNASLHAAWTHCAPSPAVIAAQLADMVTVLSTMPEKPMSRKSSMRASVQFVVAASLSRLSPVVKRKRMNKH